MLDLIRHSWRNRAYGDFYGYMLVAEGAVDIMVEPELSLWDLEALVPVEAVELREQLEEVLAVNLADDTLAWELGVDGGWRRLSDGGEGGTVDTHLTLHELTSQRERSHG